MWLTIISFIIVLGILIFFHEFGHYLIAKLAGIRVEEFALGFGPKLLSYKKGETVYSIRAIPLGGFCNMTGEFIEDEELDEKERKIYLETKKEGRCFYQKSIWKRFAVIFMGPLMNFLLAAVIFIFGFAWFGLPIDSSNTTIISEVTPGQPAAEAGLKPGDKIIAINDKSVEVWNEMASLIRESEGEIKIKFKRDDEIKSVKTIPEYNQELDAKIIGIGPELIKKNIGIFESIKYGVIQTYQAIYLIIMGFVQMITGEIATEVGGPIMIASVIGQAAREGLSKLMNWTALISINLGIINLLPIPALDGGRILFIIIEGLRGKPVDPKKESYVHFIGFVLLMLLMVFIIYKDIVRSLL